MIVTTTIKIINGTLEKELLLNNELVKHFLF